MTKYPVFGDVDLSNEKHKLFKYEIHNIKTSFDCRIFLHLTQSFRVGICLGFYTKRLDKTNRTRPRSAVSVVCNLLIYLTTIEVSDFARLITEPNFANVLAVFCGIRLAFLVLRNGVIQTVTRNKGTPNTAKSRIFYPDDSRAHFFLYFFQIYLFNFFLF